MHDEKDKDFELEISWICPASKHEVPFIGWKYNWVFFFQIKWGHFEVLQREATRKSTILGVT